MVSKIGRLSLSFLIFSAAGWADFSYQQKSQITGGAMAGMMKVAGVFSKQAREPMQTTVAVKGDRMVHWSGRSASIIDLGKETITSIDMQRKTWSVMTFAEMKEAMEKMSQRMAQNKEQGQGEMNFKVSVTPTGQAKQIDGLDTKEVIMKLEMETTDQKSGQKGSMVITTDMWLAPKVAGYQEVTDFQQRMAQKLNWTPNASLMMGNPSMAKGMAEVAKESGKLDGMPVYQVVKMGAMGQAPPAEGGTPQASSQPQAQPEKPSVGGVLGGRLGRFGGLGRKKNEPKQEEQAAQPQQQQQAPAAGGDASAALLEMTSESSGFSSAPVDGSKFEVPAGFKQVESEMKKMK